MLRVLHLLAPAPNGGLETVVLGLASGFARRGHAVLVAPVVEPPAAEHPFLEAARAAGLDLHVLELPARHYREEARRVRQLVARFRPDVVHVHGARPDVVVPLALRGTSTPMVSTVHGFAGTTPRGRLYDWLDRRALRHFDRVVAVSKPLVTLLIESGVAARRVACIRNAWQPEPIEDRAVARQRLGLSVGDGWIIGWVGRLSYEKGPDIMLEALATLRDLPVSLAFVGGGRERPALEARAQALGMAQSVLWVGPQPGVGRLMRAFDLLVLSSRTEGTPMVALEAMAAGTPLVATAVGGVPDMLPSGTALLVPPADPAALGGAIREVVGNPNAALERARKARAHLDQEFDVAAWLDRYEQLYRDLMTEPRRTA